MRQKRVEKGEDTLEKLKKEVEALRDLEEREELMPENEKEIDLTEEESAED